MACSRKSARRQVVDLPKSVLEYTAEKEAKKADCRRISDLSKSSIRSKTLHTNFKRGVPRNKNKSRTPPPTFYSVSLKGLLITERRKQVEGHGGLVTEGGRQLEDVTCTPLSSPAGRR